MSKMIEKSSGNVFADIGLADSEQELLKAKLTLQVHRLLKQSNLTQAEAAKLLRTTQPQISALIGLKPVSISAGRLMEFLTILGQDVKVSIKPAQRNRAGHLTVQVGV
jgi:predicted XRE-type DNA-binding protein